MVTDVISDVGIAKSSTSGDGTAWGLASLGLGAALLLAAPITLVFNVILWRTDHSGLPVVPALLGAVLALLMMLGLACCGIVFGMTGRRIDRDYRQPSPLATAGLLASVAAMILWIIVGVDLLVILWSF
jgi:hypothetical protein